MVDNLSHGKSVVSTDNSRGGIGSEELNIDQSSSSSSDFTQHAGNSEWRREHKKCEGQGLPAGEVENHDRDCTTAGNSVVIPQLRSTVDAHRGQQ